MSQSFDAIVVGTGGFGSGCLYHLARRGAKVLGLDRFPPAHDRGSSHGETRIIRQAYFEHPDYVPLLLRAYDLWRELERESGRELMRLCGLLICGPLDGEAVPGARLAATLHALDLEDVPAEVFARRFPGFRLADGHEAVFEPQAGFLFVEDCVRTHLDLARRHGAELRTEEVVLEWRPARTEVRVVTDRGEYAAGKLIVTAGAWSAELLGNAPALRVLRKAVLWFPVRRDCYDLDRRGCGFFFEQEHGAFYGFPSTDGRHIKAAEHTGGELVNDPLRVDRELRPADVEPVERFLANTMPDVSPIPARHSICLYTMSPDGHFLVDRHPEFPQVAFGAGFSGHGFKFTSVLGEALADLALDGQTELPIGFLSPRRLG